MLGSQASPRSDTQPFQRIGSKSNAHVGVNFKSFAQEFFEIPQTLIAGDNVLTLYYHADNNTRPSKARTKSERMRSIALH